MLPSAHIPVKKVITYNAEKIVLFYAALYDLCITANFCRQHSRKEQFCKILEMLPRKEICEYT